MIKKQSTLFPENEATLIPELDLKAAETLAHQIKADVKAHCETIEIAGSIRKKAGAKGFLSISFWARASSDKNLKLF